MSEKHNDTGYSNLAIPSFYNQDSITIFCGDCLEVMRQLEENSIETAITDPPYGLSKEPDIVEVLTHWLAGEDYKTSQKGFMGKSWDSFVPGPSIWREVYRVLKPGGTLLCFASSRTFDLMGISLRLAGFEMHPFLAWIFASGFPKATNLSKMLDKVAGAEREVVGQSNINIYKNNKNHKFYSEETGNPEYSKGDITAPATDAAKLWDGWYYGKQALKPAMEPILMAVKPHEGRMVDSCQKWGVAGLWIDGARVPTGTKGNDRDHARDYCGNVSSTDDDRSGGKGHSHNVTVLSRILDTLSRSAGCDVLTTCHSASDSLCEQVGLSLADSLTDCQSCRRFCDGLSRLIEVDNRELGTLQTDVQEYIHLCGNSDDRDEELEHSPCRSNNVLPSSCDVLRRVLPYLVSFLIEYAANVPQPNYTTQRPQVQVSQGRWPANLILTIPEDEYIMKENLTQEQKCEIFQWLQENA